LLLIFDGYTIKHLIDVLLYRVKDIQDAHVVLYGAVTMNHKWSITLCHFRLWYSHICADKGR